MKTITFSDEIYSFGGLQKNGWKDTTLKEVFLYSKKGKWSQLQSMKAPRGGHKSVVIGNKIIHVGGVSKYFFESWKNTGKNQFTISSSTSSLKNWYKHPNAFSVGAGDYQ